jgi:hypothetical protein
MTVLSYKQSLGIADKYKAINNFRDKVLNVVKKEINKYTDMSFDYRLEKGDFGKAFKYITFYFDDKYQSDEKEIHIEVLNEISSPFEQTLVGWNIRARKVVELEETYSLDVIQSAIDLTLEKEKSGEIKTTKAAIFLGILENKQKSDDELFERQLKESRKKEEKGIKASEYAEKETQYNSIQQDIYLYEDDLSRYLSAKSMGANIDISQETTDFIEKTLNIDKKMFKGYKSKFAVLDDGYMDVEQGKNIRPNMYDFLQLIHKNYED